MNCYQLLGYSDFFNSGKPDTKESYATIVGKADNTKAVFLCNEIFGNLTEIKFKKLL